jgi:hypothetical protein
MNLTMTILKLLSKHNGKPVVSHTITRAVAQSREIQYRHKATIAQFKDWGWAKEKIDKEIAQEIQIDVTLSIGKLKRGRLARVVRIERGTKLKEQIKKKRIVFSSPKDLTLCTKAYGITEAGVKHILSEKK